MQAPKRVRLNWNCPVKPTIKESMTKTTRGNGEVEDQAFEAALSAVEVAVEQAIERLAPVVLGFAVPPPVVASSPGHGIKQIENLLARTSMSTEQLSNSLGISLDVLTPILQQLVKTGRLVDIGQERSTWFWRPVVPAQPAALEPFVIRLLGERPMPVYLIADALGVGAGLVMTVLKGLIQRRLVIQFGDTAPTQYFLAFGDEAPEGRLTKKGKK